MDGGPTRCQQARFSASVDGGNGFLCLSGLDSQPLQQPQGSREESIREQQAIGRSSREAQVDQPSSQSLRGFGYLAVNPSQGATLGQVVSDSRQRSRHSQNIFQNSSSTTENSISQQRQLQGYHSWQQQQLLPASNLYQQQFPPTCNERQVQRPLTFPYSNQLTGQPLADISNVRWQQSVPVCSQKHQQLLQPLEGLCQQRQSKHPPSGLSQQLQQPLLEPGQSQQLNQPLEQNQQQQQCFGLDQQLPPFGVRQQNHQQPALELGEQQQPYKQHHLPVFDANQYQYHTNCITTINCPLQPSSTRAAR